MPPEELPGALQSAFVDPEEPAIPPHQGESAGSPDPIRPGVAQHGTGSRGGDDAQDREVSGRGIRGCGQERGLTRQRNTKALEADEHQDGEVPVGLQQVLDHAARLGFTL